MSLSILYLIVIIGELLFLAGFSAVIISFIFSSIMGSPYVPTKTKEFEHIFKEVRFEKNDVFFDLGCGDGRIVRMIAKEYGIKAVGVDVNPLLVWYARFLAKISHTRNASFFRQNIFITDIRTAAIVYIFLMPELIEKLSPQLIKQLQKGSIVISHGFRIPMLQNALYKTVERKPFPTYFYKIGYNELSV